MTLVNTVVGTCGPEELGMTLVHEHLLCGLPGWNLDPTTLKFNRNNAIETAIVHMQELRSCGVETIIDPCPADYGRDVTFNAEVSRKSGMRVISSAGLYALPPDHSQMAVERIAEMYIKEVSEGVGETGIRPGILKVATHSPITPVEEKNLHAIAMAAKATVVPIITHTDNASEGHKQLDIFEEEGVSTRRVVIGHSDGRADLGYHVSLMDRGAFIGFDRWGLEVYIQDRLRLASLIGLVSIGYADHIVLSHDSICYWLSEPLLDPPLGNPLYANWYPTHLFRNIIPQLRNAGVTEETIRTMLVDNPKRLFKVE